ncbi:PAS domain-containing protein, partial [Candidatus Parcubacteria bacterium]|nr:PAS domain-containing protein [Candidatus Parcubacteria bacterium]
KNTEINPRAKSGVANVVRTRLPEIHSHISSELLHKLAQNKEHFKILRQMKMTSRMIVPLISRDRVLGTITLVSTDPERHYGKADISLAEELARRAAIAVDNAYLYREAQEEIAHRKIAEKKLTEAYDRLEQIIESTSDGFFSIDREWRYTYLNHVALREAEKNRDELIGRQMTEVFPNSINAPFHKKYKEAMEKNIPMEFEECILGTWWEIRAYPFSEGLSVFYRDVTDRKLLDQRKDEFISMASHELKTPVTTIKLYTELLQKIVKEDKPSTYLTHMMDQLDRLAKLITDLLDLSKMQVGKLQFNKNYFDLVKLVRDTCEMIQKTTKKHTIVVRTKLRNKVWGDKDRIGQVVINLLTNAIKYSPQGDTIIVTVSQKKKTAIMSVQDFGIGIEQGYKDKIFNRFYQGGSESGKTFPGLGIGLYLAKIIVENHGGTIDADSVLGKGSLFTVILPLEPKKNEKK